MEGKRPSNLRDISNLLRTSYKHKDPIQKVNGIALIKDQFREGALRGVTARQRINYKVA